MNNNYTTKVPNILAFETHFNFKLSKVHTLNLLPKKTLLFKFAEGNNITNTITSISILSYNFLIPVNEFTWLNDETASSRFSSLVVSLFFFIRVTSVQYRRGVCWPIPAPISSSSLGRKDPSRRRAFFIPPGGWWAPAVSIAVSSSISMGQRTGVFLFPGYSRLLYPAIEPFFDADTDATRPLISEQPTRQPPIQFDIFSLSTIPGTFRTYFTELWIFIPVQLQNNRWFPTFPSVLACFFPQFCFIFFFFFFETLNAKFVL